MKKAKFSKLKYGDKFKLNDVEYMKVACSQGYEDFYYGLKGYFVVLFNQDHLVEVVNVN